MSPTPKSYLEGGLSKSFISRVIIGVTPFRVLMTLLISYLLSPLPLQVYGLGFRVALGLRVCYKTIRRVASRQNVGT